MARWDFRTAFWTRWGGLDWAACASPSWVRGRPDSSWPSGCWRARTCRSQVDLYERLPAPYGLVRFGVAPDHEKIKNRHARLRRRRGASRVPLLRQRGVRRRRHPRRLRPPLSPGLFHHRRADRPADGHPRRGPRCAATPPPSSSPGTTGTRASATSRFDPRRRAGRGGGRRATWRWTWRASSAARPRSWRRTDIADYALDALRKSRIKEVYLLGRRGPVQAAFTTPEAKELGELAGADVTARAGGGRLDPLSRAS